MSPYHCITHTHTAEVDVCVSPSFYRMTDVMQPVPPFAWCSKVCVLFNSIAQLFGCSSSSRWRSGETKLIELQLAASAPQPTNLSRDVFTFGSRVRGGLYSNDNNNNAIAYQGIQSHVAVKEREPTLVQLSCNRVTLAAIDDARIKTWPRFYSASSSYFSSTYRIGWLDLLQCEKRPIFYLRSVRLRETLFGSVTIYVLSTYVTYG